jgi:formate hydrogenlyase transcriptional activator
MVRKYHGWDSQTTRNWILRINNTHKICYNAPMASTPHQQTAVLPESQRSALMLRVWEAISIERELPSVLASLADVLLPIMPFDSIAIVDFGGLSAAPNEHDRHRLFALHVVGIPRLEGETAEQMAERLQVRAQPLKEVRPLSPYPPVSELDLRAAEPFACDDLLQKNSWYQHEFGMAASGIRSYAAVPLVARSQVIGVATFTRMEPRAFSPEQLAILRDLGRALSIATANALANEEIRKLREQLEAENSSLRAQLGQAPWFEEILAHSAALQRVLDTVEQVATTDATVLITGETGTGKELIARAIHRRSARARGPLIKVNCAAIPDTLLASELFGHERGAFSGATERRKGRFEQAHGGTLFLDEIGELPQEMQVLLLRVLQEREFERLGGSSTLQVDVRLVAATNRDLGEQVRAGKFRSDLYYRLNVFPVHVPALRERPEDVAPLAAHFAEKYGERFGRKISRIDRRTLDLLQTHTWPGNVRELENTVERAVILARNGVLSMDAEMLRGASTQAPATQQADTQERDAIIAALSASQGKVSGEDGAARRMGLPASTLEFRIKKLGIDKFRYRHR